MAWEEIHHFGATDINIDSIASWFTGGTFLTNRMRRHIPERIKGWDCEVASSPIHQWIHSSSKLRNKIIHGGYSPTELEARTVLANANAVSDKLKALLCEGENRNRHPRTVLMQLGREGLRRRNAYSGKIRRLDEESMGLDWQGDFGEFRSELMDRITSRLGG